MRGHVHQESAAGEAQPTVPLEDRHIGPKMEAKGFEQQLQPQMTETLIWERKKQSHVIVPPSLRFVHLSPRGFKTKRVLTQSKPATRSVLLCSARLRSASDQSCPSELTGRGEAGRGTLTGRVQGTVIQTRLKDMSRMRS